MRQNSSPSVGLIVIDNFCDDDMRNWRGGDVFCKCLRQLDKSGRGPTDKVIITEVTQPKANVTYYIRVPAPSTGATGSAVTSWGWTAILPPNIGI